MASGSLLSVFRCSGDDAASPSSTLGLDFLPSARMFEKEKTRKNNDEATSICRHVGGFENTAVHASTWKEKYAPVESRCCSMYVET